MPSLKIERGTGGNMRAHKMQTLPILNLPWICPFSIWKKINWCTFAVNSCFLCFIHSLQPNPLLMSPIENIQVQQISKRRLCKWTDDKGQSPPDKKVKNTLLMRLSKKHLRVNSLLTVFVCRVCCNL